MLKLECLHESNLASVDCCHSIRVFHKQNPAYKKSVHMEFSITGCSDKKISGISAADRNQFKTEVLKNKSGPTPELSVIIPSYNCATTLPETLHSVFAAAGNLTIEVIVVNDGSSDETADIAGAILSECNTSWMVLNRPNGGLSAARNTGREVATAPYIAYLDGDDLMAPKAYERMVRYAEKFDCAQVFSRSVVFSDTTLAVRPFYDSEIWDSILGGLQHRQFCPQVEPRVFRTEPKTCARIWKRAYVEEHDLSFPEGRLFEDVGIHSIALAIGGRVGILNEIGLLYREGRSGAITQSKSEGRLDVLSNVSDALDHPAIQDLNDECGRNLLAGYMRIINWCRQSIAVQLRHKFLAAQPSLHRKFPKKWVRKLALSDKVTARLIAKGLIGDGSIKSALDGLPLAWKISRPLSLRRKRYGLPWTQYRTVGFNAPELATDTFSKHAFWDWGIGWATTPVDGTAVFIDADGTDGALRFAKDRPKSRVILVCRNEQRRDALAAKARTANVANLIIFDEVASAAPELGRWKRINFLYVRSLDDLSFLETFNTSSGTSLPAPEYVCGTFSDLDIDPVDLHRAMQSFSSAFCMSGQSGLLVSGRSRPPEMPEVSVVVPVYNVEEYLDECVESLSNQTLQNREILLVNDGATDRSPEICNAWAKRDPTVRVINKENGGCASSRMQGMVEAKGEYVTFVDSDDWMEQSALDDLYRLTVLSNADVVEGDWRFAYPNNRFEHELPLESNSRWPGPGGIDYRSSANGILGRPTIWRRLYKKAFLDAHQIEFEVKARRFDDLPFQFHALSEIVNVPYVPKVILNYRQEREGQDVAISDDRLFIHFPLLETVRNIALNSAERGTYVNYLRVQLNTHLWGLEKIDPEFIDDYRRWAALDLFGPHQIWSNLKLLFWFRRKRKDAKGDIRKLYWAYLTGKAAKTLPGYGDVR
ncbi:glycosyltransferase family A protein [Ruegeria sp. R8_2]|uniref:glycosyltransferase family 2 protein n=2 Tax=unclassified Ruegeria TaxID=2625375 RepID=UPI001ADA0AB4|nr:glycosyltransferase family A protein [Ruegeria sp. R8_2]